MNEREGIRYKLNLQNAIRKMSALAAASVSSAEAVITSQAVMKIENLTPETLAFLGLLVILPSVLVTAIAISDNREYHELQKLYESTPEQLSLPVSA